MSSLPNCEPLILSTRSSFSHRFEPSPPGSTACCSPVDLGVGVMIGSVSWTRAMPLKSSRSARPLLARRFELFAGVINGARSQLREQFVLARPGPSGQAGRGRAKGEAEGETRSAEGRRRREGAGAYMRLRRPGGASLPRAEPQRGTKHGGRHRHGEWTPRSPAPVRPGPCCPYSHQACLLQTPLLALLLLCSSPLARAEVDSG